MNRAIFLVTVQTTSQQILVPKLATNVEELDIFPSTAPERKMMMMMMTMMMTEKQTLEVKVLVVHI